MDDIQSIRDRFLSNVSLTLTSMGIRLFLGLVNIMIIVRHVSPEHFGIYILIQVIAAFFIVTSDFGINVAASRFIVSAKDNKKEDWAKTLLFLKVGIAIVTILVLYAVKPLLNLMFRAELLVRFFPFVIVCYVAQSFEFFFNHVLQGFYRYKQIALADISIAFLRTLLLIILLIIFKIGIVGALFAFAISLIVGCVLLFPVRITKGRFEISYFKKTFKFSWPLEVENVLGFFDEKVYGLIIAGFLGPASLGLFEVASRIPRHLQRIFEAFRSVFFPQISELFSKGKLDEINDFLYHTLRIIGLISVFCAFLAGIFHKEIVTMLFSPTYGKISQIFFYFMIIMFFYVISYSLWLVLLGGGYSFVSMVVYIIQTIAGISVSLLLIPRLGLEGAVWGSFVLNSMPLAITVWLLRKRKIYVNKMILIKPFFPFLISLGLFFIFKPQHVLVKLVFIIPFVASSFLFSLVSTEDILILKRAIIHGFSNLRLGEIEDV